MAALLALTFAQSPFDAGRWTIADPNAKVMPYLGETSLFLDNGIAVLTESSFADGTIDVDVALHGHASFAGLLFRGISRDDYELVYLRAHRSRQWDALQYTPIFAGSEAWQLYSGKGYTAATELPANRWVHLRLAVKGYTARLYVDRAADPQLVVTDLKRPWARGQVGVWGRLGGANFANLVISSDTSATAPAAVPSAPLASAISTWELSPVWDEAQVSPSRLPDARANAGWMKVTAERDGLVNIARYRQPIVRRQASPAANNRDLVFARATITSPAARRARLVFAYSDAVHIFVNGTLLFEGEGRFRSRDPGFLGIASLGPDAIYVDLVAGRNELVFAVSETFGGWGLAARVE